MKNDFNWDFQFRTENFQHFKGEKILDTKLNTDTIEEILAFFKNYKPRNQNVIVINKSKKPPIDQSDTNGDTDANLFRGKNLKRTGADNIEHNLSAGTRDKNESPNDKNLTLLNSASDRDGLAPAEAMETDTAENSLPEIQVTSQEVMEVTEAGGGDTEAGGGEAGHLKTRNIIEVLDADYLKNNIPFMHPNNRKCTFRFVII